eukprot:2456686-Rhodomonas_salina.1
MAWHALIEKWMLKYGFKPIRQDRVTLMLNRGKSIVLLSLYVDDGICATNDKKLYKQFLKDLSVEFELSDQGSCEWYLRVRIQQDLANKLTTLTQTQYAKDVLERFRMTGATPIIWSPTHTSLCHCQPDRLTKPYKDWAEFMKAMRGN